MKYAKYILIIAIVIVFIICSWFIVFRYLPSRAGVPISHMQLKSNMIAIARKHTSRIFIAECRILTHEEKGYLGNTDNRYDKYIFDNMSDNERIVYFRAGESLKNASEPTQIYAIFECWLFMRDKVLPYKVIAIAWPHSSGGMDNTRDQMTIITIDEFEEIYQSTNIAGLSKEETIKTLADKWIEKAGYNRQR